MQDITQDTTQAILTPVIFLRSSNQHHLLSSETHLVSRGMEFTVLGKCFQQVFHNFL